MIKFFAFILMQCSMQVVLSDLSNSTADIAASALFDEYWQMSLMDDPELATSLGDHRYDDRLTEYSLKSYEKRKVTMTEFLERVTQLLPLAPEESDVHNNIRFLLIVLQYDIDQLTSGSHLFPVSKLSTPQMALTFLLKYTKLDQPKNYWDLIARYRAFPKKIDEQIDLMREGIRTNFTLNEKSLWLHGDEQNTSLEDSPYFKPFLNLSSTVSDEEAESIRANASDAVLNSVYPAFQKLDDFIKNEYRLSARAGIGVDSLPDGREYYVKELSYHLTDPGATPEEVHAMGLGEVQRISREMEEVIRSLGLNMTLKEFGNSLRNDKSKFFSSKEEALETYRSIIRDQITPKLTLFFKNIPTKILAVETVPEDVLGGPTAYYLKASPDNSTAATFFLDPSSDLPRYDAMTLAIHEGVPGHHLQISYSMEQDDIPDFRKYKLNSNAFIEGWALYAEYLGYEMGLYEDPYYRYGHLSYEIFRACRMVVDTGMHVFGWSRQRAIDYLADYYAATLNNIEREVDRYITWPGQACSYKYGELKIRELRRRAESALGEDFDIKEFHDVVLRNAGPLELLERQMDAYIRSAGLDRENFATTDEGLVDSRR